MDTIAKVTELVSEIAAASGEQSQGIDQINRAVSEMENVVQKNAANAEESASASEEMNAQADQMKYVVKGLMALVGAGDRGTNQLESLSVPARTMDEASDSKNLFKNSSRAKEITPKQVIPLNEEDFENF